jgi:hypothetical protein
MVSDHPDSAGHNNCNLAGKDTPVFWNGMGAICNEWFPFVFSNRCFFAEKVLYKHVIAFICAA